MTHLLIFQALDNIFTEFSPFSTVFIYLFLIKTCEIEVSRFFKFFSGIGQHQGKSVYRVAEIVDVVETGKIYIVGKQRTNVGLKLKFGKQERVFRLEFISNQHIMPQEFAKWKEACEEANVPLPTIEFVKAKAKEIKQAVNYNYTSDDIGNLQF